MRDDKLKSRAACRANYLLDSALVAERNIQDVDTPDLIAVLREGGINIEKRKSIFIWKTDMTKLPKAW